LLSRAIKVVSSLASFFVFLCGLFLEVFPFAALVDVFRGAFPLEDGACLVFEGGLAAILV